MNQANSQFISSSYEIVKKGIERSVTTAYYEYQISREKENTYKNLDSLYTDFARIAKRRFELGETNYLEKITTASKQKQINLSYTHAQIEVTLAYQRLLKVIQVEEGIVISRAPTLKVLINRLEVGTTPEIDFYENRVSLFEAERRFEKQQLLPDISLNYFQGSNRLIDGNLHGYQLGLKIPILYSGQSSKIKAAKIAKDIAIAQYNEYEV